MDIFAYVLVCFVVSLLFTVYNLLKYIKKLMKDLDIMRERLERLYAESERRKYFEEIKKEQTAIDERIETEKKEKKQNSYL